MNIIYKPRQSGKTSECIEILKKDSKKVLIVINDTEVRRLRSLYPELKGRIISIQSLIQSTIGRQFSSCIIDNADLILQALIPLKIDTITLTEPVAKISNTSRDDVHLEWLGGINPQAIENQEAEGQKEFVNSECLPVEFLKEKDKTILEKMGVVFGEPIPSDPIFCNAILPEGWRKIPTDHSMWSNLVDGKANIIAFIFYKAAFYDRSAHIVLNEDAGRKG